MGGPHLLILLTLLFGGPPADAAIPPQEQPSAACVTAGRALESGELGSARTKYLDALGRGSRRCAVEGLKRVVRRSQAISRLCAEGRRLILDGKAAAAKRRYLAALRLDNDSECAQKALAPPQEDDEAGFAKAAETMTNLTKLVGGFLTSLLLLLAFGLIALLFAFRWLKPSLAVEPFADGAVEPNVGSAVGGLVQKHLSDLAPPGRQRNALSLDVVSADVELVASNKSLETALSGLGDVSQLKLLVAVVGIADRLFGMHLVAKGELAPKGVAGHGVLVALHSERNGLEASGALWRKPKREGAKNPTPYYDLAEHAAAWVQYEVACALDSRARMITRNARSFALLSLGLGEQDARRRDAAIAHYVEALRFDRENVAALFNLGHILSTDESTERLGIHLIVRALDVLVNRYEELG